MKILGISGYYHDSAAALVIDGKVEAAAHEERYSRKKQDGGFPFQSIAEVLSFCSIKAADLDAIVWYEDPELKLERGKKQIRHEWPYSIDAYMRIKGNFGKSKNNIINLINNNYKTNARITFLNHHLSHASNAIFGMAGDGKTLTYTADGIGEMQTATAWNFDYRNWNNSPNLLWELNYPTSLGLFYSAITQLLGFEVNEGEYKVMGLAPYGKPKLARDLIEKCFSPEGTESLEIEKDVIKWASDSISYGSKLKKILNLTEPIDPDSALKYADIAASAQNALTEITFRVLDKLVEQNKPEEIRLAGGVALNCTLNGEIGRRYNLPVNVHPASGDAGCSLGAALFYAYKSNDLKQSSLPRSFPIYLGTYAESKATREAIVKVNSGSLDFCGSASPKVVAQILARNEVVAVSRGRAEFGPRALGNRAILASPLSTEMKNHLNASIKFREQFRPFAPVIIAENYNEFFEVLPGTASECMLLTVKSLKPSLIPAVTHVDGTSRVQKLNKDVNPWLHELLREFGEITGVPVLTLTSFNLKGEPIVQNSNDAIGTFKRSGIDYLILEDLLYRKLNSQKS